MMSVLSPAQRRRFPRRKPSSAALRVLARRGTGSTLALLFLGLAFGYGFVRGGHYETMVNESGAVSDIVARGFGFGLKAITIVGARDLSEKEILTAAGVSDRNSLLFINAADVRAKLMQVPLVADANVRKLYPDRLMIEITERAPFAVWQRDGVLEVIAADGTVIDQLRDQDFTDLPFVVGVGANQRVGEFLALLDAAGELRSKIRAGILVGERRWTLKLTNGLDVKLPEQNPQAAVGQFVRLAREMRLLDKDILAVDLRLPGRLNVRLSDEAYGARLEALARKKPKGGAI
jgi:cell division protein FtsQ